MYIICTFQRQTLSFFQNIHHIKIKHSKSKSHEPNQNTKNILELIEKFCRTRKYDENKEQDDTLWKSNENFLRTKKYDT